MLEGLPLPPRWGGFDVSAGFDVFAEPDTKTEVECLLHVLYHGGVVGGFRVS
jgi:hypothetical protein